MRWIAVLFVATACTDAPSPVALEYRVGVSRDDPFDREPSATPPVLYINGEQVNTVTMVFDPREEANDASYVIEMRHGERVVSRVERYVLDNDSLERAPNAPWASTSFCGYDNGDIRFGSESAYGGGIGDGFCEPSCAPGYCGAGLRCASRIMSTSPLASHLDCVPIGAKKRGEACSLVADADSAYDDCGESLVCVDGTCRALCRRNADCDATSSCAYLTGHAPKIHIYL